MELEKLTALQLGEKIKQRQVSVLDGVKTVFEQIEKQDSEVHAYLDTYKEEAYKLSIDGMEVAKLDNNLMLTGLALGLSKKYSLETMLKLAFAISAFKNYKKEQDVDMSDIKEIMNKVVLRRL